jgi:hypothetical protein
MGIIKGSNIEGPGGDRRNNGFLPLGGGAPTVHPANRAGAGGDRRMGSFPLGASGSLGVTPPNDAQFARGAGDKGMSSKPDRAVAVEPGKGLIPVQPNGSQALQVDDMAPRGSSGR